MVGLTVLLPLLAFCAAQGQDSEDLQAIHASRLEMLLDDTRPIGSPKAVQDGYWRNTVFQSVTRLEHHHSQLSLRAWQALNQPASDSSVSNTLVFSRRNQLPLPFPDNCEEADSKLERSLALWGDLQLVECQQLMTSAAITYANDARFVNNLAWLSMKYPAQLSASSGTRELCQAVLAFRSPQP
ncbi:MAG: hypothetical protein OSB63_04090 [Planctomycetota bacterium]|nr:hypothetical protein [Planctomycetota bacterium]